MLIVKEIDDLLQIQTLSWEIIGTIAVMLFKWDLKRRTYKRVIPFFVAHSLRIRLKKGRKSNNHFLISNHKLCSIGVKNFGVEYSATLPTL
jgi:hypothetical protein